MTEARIGRLLVASLHQAIAEVLPTRLEFYEYWLNPAGLRRGQIGLAPFAAVLSFLRQEAAYDRVAAKAGRYAAEWTAATWPRPARWSLLALPRGLRLWVTLRLATRLIRRTDRVARARATMRRGRAVVELDESLFCAARAAASGPLCGFYAAAVGRLLELVDVPADVQVGECRALGARRCTILVARHGLEAS